jgi:hypothetical protein
MVPVEWPIAATSDDGGRVPARVAGGGRLPTVRLDFFLNPSARLTEQERALMTAMLTDLVTMIADEFTSILADAEPANDDGERVLDRLWVAGLLDIAPLMRLLLRRAEEERIAAAIRSTRVVGKMRFLQSMVSDEDGDVAAAAMALILARGRRRDRFDGPKLAFDDVPAEAAVSLVHGIAAALRGDLVKCLGAAQADERLARAARSLLSRHDEGNRLEAKLFDLVHALATANRLDDPFIHCAFEEGEAALLTEALGRRSGLLFDVAWDHLTGGSGKLALLLRMAGVSRALAGEILASSADVLGAVAESEIQTFDQMSDEEVDSARNWLRLDPAYRSAIHALGSRDGQRTV